MTRYAYKAATTCCEAFGIRVIITLELPEDVVIQAINSWRIEKEETACVRVNRAYVVRIEDDKGRVYENAESGFTNKRIITYEKGKWVYDRKYKEDGRGIYCYLSRRPAELYGLEKIENGLFERWWASGFKRDECFYKDGYREGVYLRWYKYNEALEYKCHYHEGLKHGEAESYDLEGRIERKENWVAGQLHGEYKSWHTQTGKMAASIKYVEGNEHGLSRFYHMNGKPFIFRMMNNGKGDGIYSEWWDNGNPKEECVYQNGKRVGKAHMWSYEGRLISEKFHEGSSSFIVLKKIESDRQHLFC